MSFECREIKGLKSLKSDLESELKEIIEDFNKDFNENDGKNLTKIEAKMLKKQEQLYSLEKTLSKGEFLERLF